MSILQKWLYWDSSLIANVYQWFVNGIGGALLAAGWIQTADAGQPMWTGLTITGISVSGVAPLQTVTLTYTTLTGNPLAVGRALTITGFTGTNTILNATFVLTAVSVATSTTGTFTFVYTGATTVSNAVAGSPVVTATALVAANAYFGWEYWQNTDSFQSACPMIIAMAAGRGSYGNSPLLKIQCGNATNGSGAWANTTQSPVMVMLQNGNGVMGGQGTAVFECDFSFDASRFSMLMYRNIYVSYNVGYFFGVERNRNASGAYQGNYYSALACGSQSASVPYMYQASIYPPGVNGAWGMSGSANNSSFWATVNVKGTTSFGNSAVFSPVFPLVGYIDNPVTIAGAMSSSDAIEGAIVNASLYGTSHPYLYTSAGNFVNAFSNGGGGIAMRWD